MSDEEYNDISKMLDLATQFQEAVEVAKKMTESAVLYTDRAEKLQQSMNIQKRGSSTYNKLDQNANAAISKATLYTHLAYMVKEHSDKLQAQFDELEAKYPKQYFK